MTRLPHALMFAALLATGAQAKDKKPADPDKKVCRHDVPTGSLMAKSTCHTVAEWAQIDASNTAAARATLDRARQNGIGVTQ